MQDHISPEETRDERHPRCVTRFHAFVTRDILEWKRGKIVIIFSSQRISLSLSGYDSPTIIDFYSLNQLIIRIKRNRGGSYLRLLKGSRGRIITESPRFGKACMRFLELRMRVQETAGEKGLRDGNDGRTSPLASRDIRRLPLSKAF